MDGKDENEMWRRNEIGRVKLLEKKVEYKKERRKV